jgi:hypothetical protein
LFIATKSTLSFDFGAQPCAAAGVDGCDAGVLDVLVVLVLGVVTGRGPLRPTESGIEEAPGSEGTGDT